MQATVKFEGLDLQEEVVTVEVASRASFETVQAALTNAALASLGARATLSNISSVANSERAVEDKSKAPRKKAAPPVAAEA